MTYKENTSMTAVMESLHAILEAESLDEIDITDKGAIVLHRAQSPFGVPAAANDQTLHAIRETFRAVHKHLQAYYDKMKKNPDKNHLVDRINTVMVLVGEAAQKLEKLDSVFKEKISTLKEYKELQSFYRNKIVKESYKQYAGIKGRVKKHKEESFDEKWDEEMQEVLEAEAVAEESTGAHILNDVEVVKQDHLYELFYMKNEAGHKFYTEELARHLKLACDFGEYANHFFGDDPLLQVKNWEDKRLQVLAKNILKACKNSLEKYYKESLKYKDVEIVALMQKMVLALMMAANPGNLIRKFASKGCYRYFNDFQLFLREILHHREFQRLSLYSSPSTAPFFSDLLACIHDLCFQLMTTTAYDAELQKALQQMSLKKGEVKTKKLAAFLSASYKAIETTLSKHPSGPVFKALDLIREENGKVFDPLLLEGNVPGVEASLKRGQETTRLLRLPSPTTQGTVDHAVIHEEFKAFLEAKSFYCVMINYQDRTSWKGAARVKAIEEIAREAQYHDHFTVVTLAKDTDFYNQTGVYHALSNAQEFIEHFTTHLLDESTGYFFPAHLQKELFPKWTEKLFKVLEEIIFEGEKEVSLKARLNFIALAYHLIELKVMEIENPGFLVFGSKDGLDTSATATVGFMAVLATFQGKTWEEAELFKVLTVLFGPTLLVRERGIHAEKIDRLLEMVEMLEQKEKHFSKLTSFFKPETLQASLHFPKQEEI